VVEFPRFQDNLHMKVIIVSALGTGRFYAPGNIRGTHFSQRLNGPHGRSAAGKIKSMKSRNRDLPACSAVPQPTTPPRAHPVIFRKCKNTSHSATNIG